MTFRLFSKFPKLLFLFGNRLARTTLVLMAGLAGSASLIVSAIAAADTPMPATGRLVISEVQTGGCLEPDDSPAACAKDTKREFVELRSQQAEPLEVHGWQVRYLSASGGTATVLATLDGTIEGYGYMLLAHAGHYEETADLHFGELTDTGKLAESGGHIEVLDADGQPVDRIGWGSAAQPLGRAATAPKAGQSLYRVALADEELANTRDNRADFSITDTPAPRGGGYTAEPPAEPTPAPTPPDTAPAMPTCEGITLSELLPNPAGADTGHEFIELRNPTDEVISLAGCSLQTSANSKTYALPDTSLQPGEYRNFADTETGLTLTNSSGGSVWLLTATDELQVITYPGGLADNVSWALTDGSWAATYTPTPGAANILTAVAPCPAGQERNPETNRCANIATAAAAAVTTPSPCKPGQERNPETNRCRNIASADTGPAPCKPGQTRNPATNRCAAVASASTAAACKPGQERNSETNRCRNIASATTAAKPCPAGQVRNAETNRCRKATSGGSTAAKVEDVKSPVDAGSTRWLLAGVAVVGAIAYGIYEWRQEIRLKLQKLFRRPTAGVAAYRP